MHDATQPAQDAHDEASYGPPMRAHYDSQGMYLHAEDLMAWLRWMAEIDPLCEIAAGPVEAILREIVDANREASI